MISLHLKIWEAEGLSVADTPPGEAPSAAFNLTVEKVAGGWVLRWMGDLTDVRLQVWNE